MIVRVLQQDRRPTEALYNRAYGVSGTDRVQEYLLDNQIYYFASAAGAWNGTFEFRITERRAFRRARLGLLNRILALSLHWFLTLTGKAGIVSRITPYPDEGGAGVSRSVVIVRRFGITLYRMSGDYVLNKDGVGVDIEIRERFGPIPALFRRVKRVTAQIGHRGMSATYEMPLLGSTWHGTYRVAEDRRHVTAEYKSSWGFAKEQIEKLEDHEPA